MNTEKSLSQVTTAYNEAVAETEKILNQAESANNKHERAIKSYQSRLDYLEKERENVAATFDTVMSTNNNLQKELEMIQGDLGKKDAKAEEFCRER